MNEAGYPTRSAARQQTAEQRDASQLHRLNQLLAAILPTNRFYAAKLAGIQLPLKSLDDFYQLPETSKTELEQAIHADRHANLTYPFEQYIRVHRTSGTSGTPLYVYDTADDWQWWKEVWQYVLDAAEVKPGDRALMAFSFGPFIGFWSAADALLYRGVQVIPTGGLSTAARLEMTRQCQATLVCCTPTYALRMAEVATAERFDLPACNVKTLIVAGEPGGSLPEVRRRIESAWGATVVDHAGASEMGPWGYGDPAGTGMFINEADFIAEFLPHPQAQGDPTKDGGLFELMLTGLGRKGWPLIRYRTGDLVRPAHSPLADDSHAFLAGGILGRTDDMIVVRGVNIFPSSIENVMRSIEHIDEFRITAFRDGEMDQLEIEIEATEQSNAAAIVAAALTRQLGLRIDVRPVPTDTLPRSEAKSKRFIDKRHHP